MSAENVLQERLERLEAGAPLEECLADLPHEEVELLKLVAALREVPYPARDPAAVTAQRAQVLRKMGGHRAGLAAGARTELERVFRSWRDWLRPRRAFAGAVAALALCVVIAMVAARVLWPSSPEDEVTGVQLPEPAAGTPFAQTLPAEPTAGAPVATEPLPEPAVEAAHHVFVPLLGAISAPNPAQATLQEPRGLVELQAPDGTWKAARAGYVVRAGQRLRTGALSSALLVFFDGSQARLGQNTEVGVEELGARRTDGPRIVVLTQWSGETEHLVAAASGPGSRYEVRTPAASGVAQGTAFRVRFAREGSVHFSVDEGAVAVSGQAATVNLVAGQSTLVNAGQAPEEPAFRITGEGEVTEIGDTWVIAGHSFEIHAGTVIFGNPQVGDWVFVEGRLLADGTRIADRIALLRRSPANRFTITGRVEAIGETEWTVAGQAILLNEGTEVEEGIEIADLVRVEGLILEDGELLAERIHLAEEQPGLPFRFTGVVQEIADESWTISGVAISVDEETEIDPGLEVGEVVEVRGWILEDGRWLARTIERAPAVERSFEFTGAVESIDPWVVAGIPFETREWTTIATDIAVGDLVRVTGRILEDGTWLASEIARLEEDGVALRIVFVGLVESIDPWIVSGLPLEVDEETVIDGEIAVGDLVKVTVSIMADGTWRATRIELLETEDDRLGCMTITAVVVGVGPGSLELSGWPPIDLGNVVVEGELRVGSVILMQVCVREDGSIEIVRIIVIYDPEPVIQPTPEPRSTPRPPSPGEDDKVTVCHKAGGKNAHTITVARSALRAHLDHGDTLGPCE